jgi:hypothetical protein
MDTDVTHLIERLEAFEERVGVRLEALFANMGQNGYLTVNGEMHPREGTTITQYIAIHVDAYDSSGRVIAKSDNTSFSPDKFFAFEAFQALVQLPVHQLSKIRVYPKPM